MTRFYCSVLSLGVLAIPAVAAPTLDGTKDVIYGAAWAVQTVETDFTDNADELNAAYAQIDGGVLYLMLTGQVNSNFNRLNIFFDSVPGGQNVLSNSANFGGTNPENDNWAGKHVGMTFASGFEADYMLILRNGNLLGDRFDIDHAVIGGGLGAFQAATDVFGGSLTGVNSSALPNGIGIAYDDSNVLGIAGGIGAANTADALMVATGIELAIPLVAIGNPNPAQIKVVAMINGSNHDYLSNQFLPGLTPPQIRLGGDGEGGFNGSVSQIDLNDYIGQPYFRVAVPEPSSVAMLIVGLIGALAKRCRKHLNQRTTALDGTGYLGRRPLTPLTL